MNNAWEDDCDLDNLSDVDLNDEKDYASFNNGAALTAPDAKNDSTKISAGRQECTKSYNLISLDEEEEKANG